MLGIQHLRGQRREPEEAGVELVDPVKKRGATHIRRIGQRLVADAGVAQLLFGQGDDRLLTAPKVAPERRNILGARKSAGHADHRDRVLGDAHRSYPPCTSGLGRRRIAAPCRAAARWRARSRIVSALLSAGSGSLSPSWRIKSAVRSCKDAPCSISATGGSTPKSARAPLRIRTAIRESSPSSVRGLSKARRVRQSTGQCSPSPQRCAHTSARSPRAAPRPGRGRQARRARPSRRGHPPSPAPRPPG